MKHKFSNWRNKDERAIKLDSQEIPKSGFFGYLRLMIHKNGEIAGDVNYRIRASWLKWRSTS
jgi:hypothetical protein